jgi:arylsulfatase A-like enzyme
MAGTFSSAEARSPLTASDSMSPVDRALMVIWLALLTSFGELLLLLVDKTLFRYRFIFRGRDVVWMAPLADLIMFCMLGGVMFALAARWRRVVTQKRVRGILFFLAFSSVLLGVRGLHFAAVFVLAIGLAVAANRAATTWERTFVALLRRSVPVVIAAAALVGLSVPVFRSVSEFRAVRQLRAAPPGTPNVLLIVLDTVRADHLSVNGYSRRTTPRLERLAAQGVMFDRAAVTASWTLPSHASMFTGHGPLEVSTDWLAALDKRWPTLAEVLSDQGFLTGGFVGNNGYAGYEFGLDRGFHHFDDYDASVGQLILSSKMGQTITDTPWVRRPFGYWQMLGRKRSDQVNGEFLRWLSRSEDRPFFAFLNYFDAHEPLDPPAPFDRAFGAPFRSPNLTFSRATHWGNWPNLEKISRPQLQVLLDAYDDVIAYEDDQVGRLLDELEARGRLANTIVIVTSDHGEEFGEHGAFSHGTSLYWPVIHVPLIVSFPGHVPPNRRIAEPASLIDLPATIIDMARLSPAAALPGESLSSFWQAAEHSRPARSVRSELKGGPHPMHSIVRDRLHYTRSHKGVEQLYDIVDDPDETKNLIRNSSDYSSELQAFRCMVAPGCAPGSH